MSEAKQQFAPKLPSAVSEAVRRPLAEPSTAMQQIQHRIVEAAREEAVGCILDSELSQAEKLGYLRLVVGRCGLAESVLELVQVARDSDGSQGLDNVAEVQTSITIV